MTANENLDFRMATLDDAIVIQHLVQSAFRTEDSRPDWTGSTELASSFRLDLDEVRAKIGNPDVVTLIALNHDGATVGTVDVSRRAIDCGRISMLAVDDRFQRGGMGRQILAYAEDFCQKSWGVGKISLNALSTREALIRWYSRCGYRDTGEISPFPREIFAEFKLPKNLCFIEMEKDLAGPAIA